MKIIFEGNRRCQAFAVPGERVSLVTDRISENAKGQTMDEILTIVTDPEHRVCDIELLCDPSRVSSSIAFHVPGNSISTEREVDLDVSSPVRWHLDTHGYFRIQFRSLQPTAWLRLGNNDLWLGFWGNNDLVALVYPTTRYDPTAQLESDWLDEIGAT